MNKGKFFALFFGFTISYVPLLCVIMLDVVMVHKGIMYTCWVAGYIIFLIAVGLFNRGQSRWQNGHEIGYSRGWTDGEMKSNKDYEDEIEELEAKNAELTKIFENYYKSFLKPLSDTWDNKEDDKNWSDSSDIKI